MLHSPGLPPGYELKRQVAEGGMGVVYEAVHQALGRRVALKVLHPHLLELPQVLARFRREAQVLAKLEHPHAVRVFDFLSEPQPTLVMEFIDGESAELRLARLGRLPLTEVAQVAQQVLAVLEEAHRLGIVHRDLKPGNLMFDASHPHPYVKVVDFGIALLQQAPADERLTRSGQVPGTAAYMSPEQASGESVDARSDQYALACVLFELLTGRPPFDSSNPVHVLSAHVFREPPTLEECGLTTVPRGFERALRKALEKSPVARFATAGAFGHALAAGLVPSQRGEPERKGLEPSIDFVASEFDDPAVGLLLDGAPPQLRELMVTALAAAGVASSAGRGEGPVVVVWAEAGDAGMARVDELLAGPACLVLLCGPEDDLTLMTRAIEHGAHEYVGLPLQPATFVRQVVRALRSQRRPS